MIAVVIGIVGRIELNIEISALKRAKTYGGAIDAYAKGIMTGNASYIGIVLQAENDDLTVEEHIDEYRPKGNIATTFGYYVYNLSEQPDGTCSALLAFDLFSLFDEKGEHHDFGCAFMPIRVWENDGYWFCEPNGYPEYRYDMCNFDNFEGGSLGTTDSGMPYIEYFSGEISSGIVEIERRTMYMFEDAGFGYGIYPLARPKYLYYDEEELGEPDLDAKIIRVYDLAWCRYICDAETGPEEYVGIQFIPIYNEEDMNKKLQKGFSWNTFGQTENFAWKYTGIDENWDGYIGTVWALDCGDTDDHKSKILPPIEGYRVAVHWDKHIVEELMLS